MHPHPTNSTTVKLSSDNCDIPIIKFMLDTAIRSTLGSSEFLVMLYGGCGAVNLPLDVVDLLSELLKKTAPF